MYDCQNSYFLDKNASVRCGNCLHYIPEDEPVEFIIRSGGKSAQVGILDLTSFLLFLEPGRSISRTMWDMPACEQWLIITGLIQSFHVFLDHEFSVKKSSRFSAQVQRWICGSSGVDLQIRFNPRQGTLPCIPWSRSSEPPCWSRPWGRTWASRGGA